MIVRLLSLILAVQSRQDAVLRSAAGKLSNPAPFDTGSNDI